MTKTQYIIVAENYKRIIQPNPETDVTIYADFTVKITEVKDGKTITTWIPREQIHYITEIQEP
ncbi:MAG: hypothetical protein QXQ50_09305 [Candidatus Bathyarchaeia archaeon]